MWCTLRGREKTKKEKLSLPPFVFSVFFFFTLPSPLALFVEKIKREGIDLSLFFSRSFSSRISFSLFLCVALLPRVSVSTAA